jgi:hypothetical protein
LIADCGGLGLYREAHLRGVCAISQLYGLVGVRKVANTALKMLNQALDFNALGLVRRYSMTSSL